MDEVTFSDQPNYQRATTQTPGTSSFLSNLVIQMKLAKDEKEAQRVLLIIAIIASLLAVVIFILFDGAGHSISQQELDGYIQAMPHTSS